MTDMTIRDVRVTVLRMPWANPDGSRVTRSGRTAAFSSSMSRPPAASPAWATCFTSAPACDSIATFLEECVIPRVKGKDATAVEAIWQRPVDHHHDLRPRRHRLHGDVGARHRAVGRGRQARDLPLHRLWGHYRSKIPIYGSGCFRGAGGDGMIEKALTYVSRATRRSRCRSRMCTRWRRTSRTCARMREAVGPDIDIMIDVNMGWSADVAIEMGRKFEQYDIYWLEEPVPADDFAGYQRIAAALDMRVVGGETHFTRYDLRPFFINPCLPILQPDPMRGGMTDLRKIATLADTWGITIAPHLFPELNVHLLASIPNGIWAENMGLLDDLWVDPPEIADGFITAPERPGHGLRFKDEVRRDFVVTQ